jgi:hypothetical protein
LDSATTQTSPAAHRRVARRGWQAVRGVTARRGTSPLVIDELVSPLRYDVLVRARLFSAMRAAPSLGETFVQDVVHDSDYAIWFKQVAVSRFHPELLSDEVAFRAALSDRVRQAVRLWLSFSGSGYDKRYPIHVRMALPDAATVTGKHVSRRFHIADGCHRLALLITAGFSEVPPAYYRVDPSRLRELPDNTARLLAPLSVGENEYAAFIGRGFGLTHVSDVASLLAEARHQRPDVRADISRIVRADLAHGLRVAAGAETTTDECTPGGGTP